MSAMTYGYALQVAGIIAGMSVACLTALKIASTIFDRHTRADAARATVEAGKVQDRHRAV
ncbi:hypothetical protein MKK58_10430 [Methylobacterium sp. J-078]|uniref:hypothetical protein n=1 Tax=Methylobacterium sp. J-078 TaxID=2836657 RepID=UPI001FBBBF96|nr:hypothetical protein [Methylobacterium sp. J-078]MCJ2044938.1 hypothetical protein [Methylobacterium sp. J-078]